MQIFVKPPSGITITLDVEYSDTIQTIKNKICDTENILSNKIRIFYGNKWLQDHLTISNCDCNIEKDTILKMRISSFDLHLLDGSTNPNQESKKSPFNSTNPNSGGPISFKFNYFDDLNLKLSWNQEKSYASAKGYEAAYDDLVNFNNHFLQKNDPWMVIEDYLSKNGWMIDYF